MEKQDSEVICKEFFDFSIDIISEILSSLPIRSLLRCRIVCKKWYGLTKTPGFIVMQLDKSCKRQPCFINHPLSATHSPSMEYPYYILNSSPLDEGKYANTLLILDIAKDKEVSVIKIPSRYLITFRPLRIMSSCNGLLCLSPNNFLSPVLICNPITDEIVILPSSDTKLDLLFHQVCLCYEASTHTYSAVRAYRYKKNKVTVFEILSRGEYSWKKLKPPHGIDNFEIYRPVLWKGVVHWGISRKVDNSGCECILSFDLNEKKFEMTSFPYSVEAFSFKHNLELLVLNGRLTLIEVEDTVMKLWEVIGTVVGDFSLICRKTFDTNVKWGGLFRCSVLSRSTQNGNLLKVTYGKSAPPRSLISHFVVSSPEMTEFEPLQIHNLPDHFDTFAFNPSLVSPGSTLFLRQM